MAGFDGYDGGDARQAFNESLIDDLVRHLGADRVTALTPTRYRIAQGSVYAPTKKP